MEPSLDPYTSSNDHLIEDDVLFFDNIRFLLAPIVLTVRQSSSQDESVDATSTRGTIV
jgi:hypothetical protein